MVSDNYSDELIKSGGARRGCAIDDISGLKAIFHIGHDTEMDIKMMHYYFHLKMNQ